MASQVTSQISNQIWTDNLTAYDAHLPPFTLIKPKHTPTRNIQENIVNVTDFDHLWLDQQLFASDIVAFDYETTGLRVYDPTFKAVGIGLAWNTNRIYIVNNDDTQWAALHELLLNVKDKLIAHNLMFDASVFLKYAGSHAEYLGCTYAMYRQLANEGWLGQTWGLKDAQKDVLLWKETNEVDLDTWLIDNYHTTNSPTQLIDESRLEYESRYRDWVKGQNSNGKPVRIDKSKMHLAPTEILSKYCMLDAEATYLLYTEHFAPLMSTWPGLWDFHVNEFVHLVKLLSKQYLDGLALDISQLNTHKANLNDKLLDLNNQIRNHSDCSKYIVEYENLLQQPLWDAEPEQYLKRKPLPPEPPRHTKNGKSSKTWENWFVRKYQYETTMPPTSKNWVKWNEKIETINTSDEYKFNPQGDKHVAWLMYERMYKWKITKPFVDVKSRGTVLLTSESGRKVELELTKTGKLPIDETALMQMGDIGKLLNEYSITQKELSMLNTYTDLSSIDGLLHPNFRAPGTITGRLSSNDINVQQISKTEGTLSCFIPREGYVWVDVDVNSLEQVVLAHLSQDNKLMELYGPGAKNNDVYLYVASHIPGLKEPIFAIGYRPNNPTQESVDYAKKSCKRQRDISKTITLGSSYGAGPKKLHKTLVLSGIDITLQEVYSIHKAYHQLFSGVNRYYETLKHEWASNRGYVSSPLGHPISVDESKLKDIGNRVIQKTGHDIHTMWVYLFTELLDKEQIEWYPVILDWHDQSIVECRPQDAERVKQIMSVDSFAKLNAQLKWSVQFKGHGNIVNNLAEAKL